LHIDQTMADGPSQRGETATQLVREALEQMRELVRLEVALAREEARDEWVRARAAAVALGGGAVFALMGLTMLLVAIATGMPHITIAALAIGAIVIGLGGALGLVGYSALPRKPMVGTKERIETDLKQLKERVA
jgi:hypothetical protein